MEGCTFIEKKETDTQVFITYNESFIVVCFRGTDSPTDWMNNVKFLKVVNPKFPQRYISSGVRVHNGFNHALEVRN